MHACCFISIFICRGKKSAFFLGHFVCLLLFSSLILLSLFVLRVVKVMSVYFGVVRGVTLLYMVLGTIFDE